MLIWESFWDAIDQFRILTEDERFWETGYEGGGALTVLGPSCDALMAAT